MSSLAMRDINDQLQLLESFIPHYHLANPSVSAGSVGWHIEHSLITIRRVIGGVKSSDPGTYKSSFKFSKFFVLTFNYIPRGSVKAPKVVLPDENLNIAALNESLSKTKQLLGSIDTIADNQYFLHPVFGNLNKKPTIKFLMVHTKHHLKIIKDIVKGGK